MKLDIRICWSRTAEGSRPEINHLLIQLSPDVVGVKLHFFCAVVLFVSQERYPARNLVCSVQLLVLQARFSSPRPFAASVMLINCRSKLGANVELIQKLCVEQAITFPSPSY